MNGVKIQHVFFQIYYLEPTCLSTATVAVVLVICLSNSICRFCFFSVL